MQFLPDVLQDLILFPKYYKNQTILSLNQKLYLSFQLNNCYKIKKELNYYINIFNQCQNSYLTDFINPDYFYLSKKPIHIFILYQSLKKKNKSITHLIPSNSEVNYNFANYIFNNYNFINSNSNNTIESNIHQNYF